MDDADEFYIYLPGAAIKGDLRESDLYWDIDTDIRSTLPSGYYFLYNVGGEKVFKAYTDDFEWRDVWYDTEDQNATLRASYYGECRLVLQAKKGISDIFLEFTWRDVGQTEFHAADIRGSGDYHISIDVSEDLSTVKVKLTSINGVDLSAWGGTTDGYFEAVFVNE